MAAGSIYLVPVPIGNLGDITLRALETLKMVSLIAAEDTRSTRFLLNHYEIPAPRLLSLHKYNEKQRTAEILAMLHDGTDIAVVSDAGSPGISDPAILLIQNAIAADITIIPLPGATALIPALTASGLDTLSFQFMGFLPLKLKDRAILLERIKNYASTSVIYEAPHRLRKTLQDILDTCGSRPICICREISKLFEEFIRGDLETILAEYKVTEKGEMVIIIGAGALVEAPSEEEIVAFIDSGIAGAAKSGSLAEDVSGLFGINRNQAYQMVLKRKAEIR